MRIPTLLKLAFATYPLLVSSNALSADGNLESKPLSEVDLDFSIYQVQPANMAKAATVSFLSHGWEIKEINKQSVTGVIVDEDNPNAAYEVHIHFESFPLIKIIQSSGPTSKPKWLGYLKDDMLFALFSCMK